VEKEKEKKRGRKKVSLAMIAANNHYAGFGPGTANLFRSMVGLPSFEIGLIFREYGFNRL
jgi:hypothetical protein